MTSRWLVALGAIAWIACGGSTMSVHPGSGGGPGKSGGTTGGTTVPSSAGTGGDTGGGWTGETTVSTTGGATSTGGAAAASSTGGNVTAVSSGGTSGAGGSTTRNTSPVVGGPCSVEGAESACATAGPNPCVQCWGSWLYCQHGTWMLFQCDPPPLDAGLDLPLESVPDRVDANDVPPDQAPPLDAASLDASIDGDGILRGYMVFAFELMAFEPCGTTYLIWADLQGWEKGQDLLPDLGPYCQPVDGGQAPCPGRYYVELTGTIFPNGSYGHMGKFSQQLMIGAYLAASLTEPAACPFLPPVYPN
jgi:hypothetical protein